MERPHWTLSPEEKYTYRLTLSVKRVHHLPGLLGSKQDAMCWSAGFLAILSAQLAPMWTVGLACVRTGLGVLWEDALELSVECKKAGDSRQEEGPRVVWDQLGFLYSPGTHVSTGLAKTYIVVGSSLSVWVWGVGAKNSPLWQVPGRADTSGPGTTCWKSLFKNNTLGVA